MAASSGWLRIWNISSLIRAVRASSFIELLLNDTIDDRLQKAVDSQRSDLLGLEFRGDVEISLARAIGENGGRDYDPQCHSADLSECEQLLLRIATGRDRGMVDGAVDLSRNCDAFGIPAAVEDVSHYAT